MLLDLEWLKNPTGAYGSEVYRTMTRFLENGHSSIENAFANKLGKCIYPQMMNKLPFVRQKEIDELYMEYVGEGISKEVLEKRLAWLETTEDALLASQIEVLTHVHISDEEKEKTLLSIFKGHPEVTIDSEKTKMAIKNLIAIDNSWLVPLEKIIRLRAAA